jgi:hypothetical protein
MNLLALLSPPKYPTLHPNIYQASKYFGSRKQFQNNMAEEVEEEKRKA